MKKRPIYIFDTTNDTGVDKLPVNSLVMVEGVIYSLASKTGITSATTISQAFNSGALKGTVGQRFDATGGFGPNVDTVLTEAYLGNWIKANGAITLTLPDCTSIVDKSKTVLVIAPAGCVIATAVSNQLVDFQGATVSSLSIPAGGFVEIAPNSTNNQWFVVSGVSKATATRFGMVQASLSGTTLTLNF